MKSSNSKYKRHRFPAEIIQHTARLYRGFSLSHRDIGDLLAKRDEAISTAFSLNTGFPYYPGNSSLFGSVYGVLGKGGGDIDEARCGFSSI